LNAECFVITWDLPGCIIHELCWAKVIRVHWVELDEDHTCKKGRGRKGTGNPESCRISEHSLQQSQVDTRIPNEQRRWGVISQYHVFISNVLNLGSSLIQMPCTHVFGARKHNNSPIKRPYDMAMPTETQIDTTWNASWRAPESCNHNKNSSQFSIHPSRWICIWYILAPDNPLTGFKAISRLSRDRKLLSFHTFHLPTQKYWENNALFLECSECWQSKTFMRLWAIFLTTHLRQKGMILPQRSQSGCKRAQDPS